jgi:hypothetical protein
MAQGVVLHWKTQLIRLFSTGALLLPLSVAPLYLVGKHATLTNAALHMSDSTSVLDEPDTRLPFDSDTDANKEVQGLDEEEPLSNPDATLS